MVRIAEVVEPRVGPNPVGTLSPEPEEVSCHRLPLVSDTEEPIVAPRLRARDEWDEEEHGSYEDDETDDQDLRPKPHSLRFCNNAIELVKPLARSRSFFRSFSWLRA